MRTRQAHTRKPLILLCFSHIVTMLRRDQDFCNNVLSGCRILDISAYARNILSGRSRIT